MDLLERGVGREELARGRLLRVVRDRVVLPDGDVGYRECVIHPGAVMVVPLLGNGRVVLERQFRYPIGRTLVEFPAGKLDPEEPSWACARRELAEETGFTASEWAYAGVIHPVPAYSSEHIDLWFARGLSAGVQCLDRGEFLEVFDASVEELLEMVRCGAVTDGKTVAAALWLQNVWAGRWGLAWMDAQACAQLKVPGAYAPGVDHGAA